MDDLSPLFKIAGMAVATLGLEYVLEKIGHGDKGVFVRVVGYSVVTFYSLRVWMDYLRRIAGVFGVFL